VKQYIIVCLVFLCLKTAVGYSQYEEDFKLERTNPKYEEGDWISYPMTRWVRSLAQGIEYVYFSTTGGISRYNYYTNKWDFPWTLSNGLANNDILVVAYDIDTNYLWCATPVSVSCYFSTFRRWENYYYKEIGVLDNNEIISIGFDDNNVWIESQDGSFFRGDKQGSEIFHPASSYEADKNSIRWFGYRGQNINRPPEFFMSDGYWFYPEGYITNIRLDRYDVSDWLLDKWGKYWVTTLGLGVGKAEERIEQLELLTYGLFINNVSAMALEPESRTMWVGAFGEFEGESGVTSWQIDYNEWSYFQSKYITEFRNDQVTSIAVDAPYTWFGTEYGLAQYDKNRDRWQTFDVFSNLGDNYVYDVAVDEENVWVATANGLTRIFKNSINSGSLETKQINRSALHQIKVFDVEVMKNLVWLGTEFGVYVYDMSKDEGGFQAEAGGPMNEEVYAASCFEKEAWFGSGNGIEVFDVEKQEWLGGPHRRYEPGEIINYIKAGKDAVWAGTNFGVLKFDRERNYWIKFTIEDGLINNIVNTIELDGDYVWFGTPEGITRFYWNDPHRVD